MKKLNTILISLDDEELKKNIVEEFRKNIYNCLELMYKKMPKYLFAKFYTEEIVTTDHAINHSLEVLSRSIDILSREINAVHSLDVETLVYSSMLHDISCSLTRLEHETNSATWAKSILTGVFPNEKVDKIFNVCLGHKKIKKGTYRPEHEIYEARLLHDADGLSATLDLGRILGVWLAKKEAFINLNLTINDRYELIQNNRYLKEHGGDAVNDLMRQFLRRDAELYLTSGAKEIINASKSNPYSIIEMLMSPEIKNKIKNSGNTDADINKAVEIVNATLPRFITGYSPNEMNQEVTYKNIEEESAFTMKAKRTLFKQLASYLFKRGLRFKQNIAISDIHGGYSRLTELIINLLDSTFDINGLSDQEIENEIIKRLSYTGNNNLFYILGDMLDRGNRQVEVFQFIKKVFETGKARYVIGNHDLYAFMNLLGLHLPYYKDYKGIKDNYFDFKGRNIKKLLEKKRDSNVEGVNDKLSWAKKFDEYMQYADKRQNEIWNEKEKYLQNLFFKTFGFQLHKEGKDILNNPQNSIFSSDPELLNFHKYLFGRNVGIAVYTGIRAVDKMSINWWFDRQTELGNLKNKYPQYRRYWKVLSDLMNEILLQQEQKMENEYPSDVNGNWQWAVIDAIMYRNYESTEWNALDWGYHKNWGGGDKGLISQRNAQLMQKGKKQIDHSSYFNDSLFIELLNFFKENFYLYRIDEYGIYYMHSLLPVDDDGDVSIGYVDKSGALKEYDQKGKRIKGFYYKGKHYKGKNIFRGLSQIGNDIRNYDIASNNLSEIFEALTLLTVIYADNTTRIKPKHLKEMKEKFGFSKVLNRKGVTTLVVGHNPITTLDRSYEYVKVRFFNKEFTVIKVVHIDGNMSPEFAPPRGAGLARLIGGGISTRGFISGQSTEITSSVNPDVNLSVFMTSVCLNLFPFMKKILIFTSKVNDFIYSMEQQINSKYLSKSNTILIDFIANVQELHKMEIAHCNDLRILPISLSGLIKDLVFEKNILETKTVEIDGENVLIDIVLNKIKVAKGYMYVITIDYDKDLIKKSEDLILKNSIAYILEQIANNKYNDYIKHSANIALMKNNLYYDFEKLNKKANKKFTLALEKSFGIIPVLYDVRNKKSIEVVELIKYMSLDKIQNMLSAA